VPFFLKEQNYYSLEELKMAADDVTGTWKMETITQFQFNLALIQNGNTITGTMARAIDGVPVDAEPVDTVLGTVNSDGEINFTRTRSGEFTQVYTGQITGSGDSRSIRGNFTHNGDPNPPSGGAWFAAFVPMVELFLPPYSFVGNMEVNNNQFHFNLALAPTGDTITGTMTRTNGVEPVDNIFGSVAPNGKVEFTRVRPGNFVQVYTGLYTGQVKVGVEIDISMQGTFTHNGAPDPTNSGWFATLSSTIISLGDDAPNFHRQHKSSAPIHST
jgi:hypothetical protein